MDIKPFSLEILLVSSLAMFSAAHADESSSEDSHSTRVFVTKEDGTISLIKSAKSHSGLLFEEVQSANIGITGAQWTANQYQGTPAWWWVGLPTGKIIALNAKNSLDPLLQPGGIMTVNTYTYAGVPPGLPTTGANFVGTVPRAKRVWNAAREIDEVQEIDADPDSPTFGTILTHINIPLSAAAGAGSTTLGKMRPCDVSVTPDGKFLFEPDLGGETITAVDIKQRQVVAQLTLPRVDPANRVRPFMLTTNGKYAIVDNMEAPFGTYSIVDVSDPYHPVHVKKLTQADGVGLNPQTNEFTPDGKSAYLIANGSPTTPGQISVLDLESLLVVKNIALPAGCRPHAGDFSEDGHYFFVNCSGDNSLAVISTEHNEVVQNVALTGTTPRGVIVR